MKYNNSVLYIIVFVIAAAVGFGIVKGIQSKDEETSLVSEDVSARYSPEKPLIPSNTKPKKKILPPEEIKEPPTTIEVEKKPEVKEKKVEPVMGTQEFKDKVLSNSFVYKRDFHKGNTPKFNVIGTKAGESKPTDIPSLRRKLNPDMDPHWDDFDVISLEYDEKGKIKTVTISAIYNN